MQSFQAVGYHQDRGSMYKKIGNSEESIWLEYNVQVEITEMKWEEKPKYHTENHTKINRKVVFSEGF